MLAYNLKSDAVSMSFGELDALQLGERGRGRHLEIVPCPKGIEDGEYVRLAKSKSGKPKILRDKPRKDFCNFWVARITTEGVYTRNTEGCIYTNTDAAIEVISKGQGAYGDAGRIGVWYDYLLIVKPGTLIKVHPSGCGKLPDHFLYFGTEKVHKIKEEEIDVFIDLKNIETYDFKKI